MSQKRPAISNNIIVPAIAAGAILLAGWYASPRASRPVIKASASKAFGPTLENATQLSDAARAGMVWIPGGEFSMGSEDPTTSLCGGGDSIRDARPIHRVSVEGFWMDATEVTNEQFAAFVNATQYVTVAERPLRPEDFPEMPASSLLPGSMIFVETGQPVSLQDFTKWWRFQNGANWRNPNGPGSSIAGREKYPVVHIAYEDAEAYARWAGKRLPTEAEWEFAARGGIAGASYMWGVELKPHDRWMANTFQGKFPAKDSGEDGYAGIAPVAHFPSNGYGLYDMAGNVWEWCSDWYRPDYYQQLANSGIAYNPQGPRNSFDPGEPGIPKRVHRGGSFLCTDQYCTRYLVGSRDKGDPNTSTNHLGFRCVRDPKSSSGWAAIFGKLTRGKH